MLLIWALHRWSYRFEGRMKPVDFIDPLRSETTGPQYAGY
jgi:hypothetical protein